MTVYLVGAGPGDPGLLTRRGAEVLSRADVVVYDRLILPDLLDLAPATAQLVDVGKRPGESAVQEQIHDLLIEHGQKTTATGEALTVVRLKGGDPFVFGRGSEEVAALRAAGIDYEVVPGVSSAFAVPAYAGVPVTHRGLSTSVTVVTGHVGDPSAPGGVAWEALARAGGTLVILMGMEKRAEIARLLMEGGRPAETPVLVVQWGTTPAEVSVRVTLEELGEVQLGAPATIVVGAVAGLDLGGRPLRPLSGLSVVVTRPRAQSGELVSGLAAAGARVVVLPVMAVTDPVDTGPLERAARDAGAYDWIVFTSANAVDRFVALLPDGRALGGVRLAAVGSATAAALAGWHLRADLVPDEATAEGLVAAMPAPSADPRPATTGDSAGGEDAGGDAAGRPGGGRVLFPRGAEARDILAPGLRGQGWVVDEVVAYRTVAAGEPEGVTAKDLEDAVGSDVITFTSPSTVDFFLALSGGRTPPVIACIGPVTAEAARKAGLVVDVMATEHTAAGLVEALIVRMEKLES
ncbi:MAG TPA: uroporphyrinogen-III C-methyltransferase [Acidimicrobiales bacterium]